MAQSFMKKVQGAFNELVSSVKGVFTHKKRRHHKKKAPAPAPAPVPAPAPAPAPNQKAGTRRRR